MFFMKSLPKTTSKRAKLRLKMAFDVNSDATYACSNVKQVANSVCSTDIQFTSLGFEPYALKVLHITDSNKMYVLASDGVYAFSDGTAIKIINDSCPNAIAHFHRNYFVICGEGLGVYLIDSDDSADHLLDAGFNSLVVSSERLIGVIDNLLYFNAPRETYSWQVSHRAELLTKCQAVCYAGGKTYLLGDTCYLFSSDAEEVELSVRAIGSGYGQVEVNSMAYHDGKVVFATDSGLHILSPSGIIAPIFDEISDFVTFDGCVACKFDGKYYLSCKRKSGSGEQNDLTLILNIDTEQIDGVLGVGFDSLMPVGDSLYVVREGNVFKSSVGNAPSSWKCDVDFGTDAIKHLQSLAIHTKQDVEVWIGNGQVSRLYRVKGKKSIQNIPIRGAGRKFNVKLASSAGMCIDSVQLTCTTYGEV